MKKMKLFSWFRRLIFRRSGRTQSSSSFVAEFEKEKKHQEDKDLYDYLRKVFQTCDDDNDGFVHKDNLIEIVNAHGGNLDQHFMEYVVRVLPDHVDFETFHRFFVMNYLDLHSVEDLIEAFAVFDAEKTGRIDGLHLKNILSILGAECTTMADEMLAVAPTTDGMVDYVKFAHQLVKRNNDVDDKQGGNKEMGHGTSTLEAVRENQAQEVEDATVESAATIMKDIARS